MILQLFFNVQPKNGMIVLISGERNPAACSGELQTGHA